MRLRDEVIGALNLFGAGPATFSRADVWIGQALADVATIGLLKNETCAAARSSPSSSRAR